MSQPDGPTLLLIGAGDPIEAALTAALEGYGLSVDSTTAEAAIEAALAAAPDLIVLLGDAVKADAVSLLNRLAQHPTVSVIPVALLAADGSLDQRLRAFRSGAVAVIERGASVDAIAVRLRDLARDLPEQRGEATGTVGEITLDELVSQISTEIRRGILSVEATGADGKVRPVRLVLGAGRPVAEALQGFVQNIRPLISKAEPLKYEFHESAVFRLDLLDPGNAESNETDLGLFHALRILIVDDDLSRADTLAQALRAQECVVALTDLKGRGWDRARDLDPTVIIADADAIQGEGYDLLIKIRQDSCLRWASLLLVPWDEIWKPGAALDLSRLAGKMKPLIQQDTNMKEAIRQFPSADTRLETLGPSRLLRALGNTPGIFHANIRGSRATIRVDVADGLIVGAAGEVGETHHPLEGMHALTALMGFASGRVHVDRRGHPAYANVMLPVDEALHNAWRESRGLPHSIVPPKPHASADVPAIEKPIVPEISRTSGEHLFGLPLQTKEPKPSPTNYVPPAPMGARGEPIAASPKKNVVPARAPAPAALATVASDATIAAAPITKPSSLPPPPPASFEPAKQPLMVPKRVGPKSASRTLVLGTLNRDIETAPTPPPPAPSPVDLLASEPEEEILDDFTEREDFDAIAAMLSSSSAFGDETEGAAPISGLSPRLSSAPPPVPSSVPPAELQAVLGHPFQKQKKFLWIAVAGCASALAAVGWITFSGKNVSKMTSVKPHHKSIAKVQTQKPVEIPSAPSLTPPVTPKPAEVEKPEAMEPPPVVQNRDDQVKAPETIEATAVPPAAPEAPRRQVSEAEALSDRADRLRRAKNWAKAEEYYLRSLREQPNFVPAMVGLSRLHLARGDGKESVRWADKVVQRKPNSPNYHMLLAQGLEKIGSHSRAQGEWRKVLALDPRNATAREHLRK